LVRRSYAFALKRIFNFFVNDFSRFYHVEKNSFTGVFPTELGRFSQVRSFNAASNNLEGTLPPEIGDLTELFNFDLGSNKLSGSLPSEFGQIETLEDIELSGNILIGSIPTEFGLVKTLKSINFGSNDLTGPIPSEFGNIEFLKGIGLGDNSLTGSIPSEFGLIDDLERIDLGNNALTGSIPSEFGEIEILEDIRLGSNALIGPIPSEFGLIIGLQSIDLGNNALTGSIPVELGDLNFLTQIKLGNNELIGTIPSELALLHLLIFLDLSNNHLTGDVPNEFEDLENLEFLDIGGTDVTPQRFMCSLHSLEEDISVILDCSNYCGTVDEECNSESLRGATCLDVGCSEFGIPQCTSNCRLDFSTCDVSDGKISFRFDLQTVDRAHETRWEIRDDSTSLWSYDGSYRNYDAFITEFRCLREGCYIFELFDEGNDGICCGTDGLKFGNYSVFINEEPITDTQPNFGSSTTHNIGNCTLLPLKPTEMPSQLPSSMPSQILSENPSNIPSEYASQIPSKELSLHPSQKPSSIPSMIPTEDMDPIYIASSYDSQCRPLFFRVSDNTWSGKFSTNNEIGVSGGGWNYVHAELTSRILDDEETFTIVGDKSQVGAGLCIDSCNLESNFGIRFRYNCVGFYGNRAELLAADSNDVEYTVPVDKPDSNTQGFTYDRANNCVTHIGSASQTCTALPAHFNGNPVRAIGQVWNSASAIVSSNRRMVQVPSYNSTSWNSQCREIEFRISENTWKGRWSNSTQIGITNRPADKTHIELTSRRLNDGEVISVVGSSEFVGIGLCIDSCALESNYRIKGEYNCVGFFGNDTVMWATHLSGSEYSVSVVNKPSKIQGFSYDHVNSCITHVDAINGSCTSLPSHFDGQPVRAIVQVWNNTFADIV